MLEYYRHLREGGEKQINEYKNLLVIEVLWIFQPQIKTKDYRNISRNDWANMQEIS